MKEYAISESEWKIMQVIWKNPGSGLKEIYDALDDISWEFTTVRTLVTRLRQKGIITADKSDKHSFLYYPAVSEQECKVSEAKHFLTKVFDGSVSMFVSAMAKESKLTEKERDELLKLISKMED